MLGVVVAIKRIAYCYHYDYTLDEGCLPWKMKNKGKEVQEYESSILQFAKPYMGNCLQYVNDPVGPARHSASSLFVNPIVPLRNGAKCQTQQS